ncbi:MAG: hypothetical protein U1F66_00055 [bacterium]
MGFFDEAEVKCMAGVGLSALGVGALGLPLAVDGCSEAVEKVVEQAEAVIDRAPDVAQDAACFATDTSALLLGSLTPFAPLTTLTMRYMPSACSQEGDEILEALKNAVLESPFLIGFGGIATYLMDKAISKQDALDAMKALGEGLATSLLAGSLIHLGAAVKMPRALRQVPGFHQRLIETIEGHKQRLEAVETFRIRRLLTPEQMERLYQEINDQTKRQLQEL